MTGFFASMRGRNWFGWGIFGFCLPIVAIPMVFILSKKYENLDDMIKCKSCAEWIKAEANKCKFCRSDV
ncbi:MAG: hypothetical protein GQ540_03390 [Lutibacter sp.]|nr:hypothetical protein [Lutibacter sp.]